MMELGNESLQNEEGEINFFDAKRVKDQKKFNKLGDSTDDTQIDEESHNSQT